MAQHLCIVARDNPLLLGYLHIALEQLSAAGHELEIVIDRRPDPSSPGGAPHHPLPMGREQRRLHGVDALLRSRGYAIVSREMGEDWHVGDGAELQFEARDEDERDDEMEPAGFTYRTASGRRRLLLAGGAAVVVVVGALIALPGDPLDRVAGVVGHAASSLRSSPEPSHPPPASDPAPAREPKRTATATPPVATEAPPEAVRAPVEVTSAPAPAVRAPEPPAPAVRAPAPPTPAVREPAPPPAAVRAPEPPAPAVRAPAPPDPAVREPAPPARPAPTLERRAQLPPRRPLARQDLPLPKKETTLAAAAISKPPEFRGTPRVEMTRERDASGRTAAITVRVTDPGGRPLPAADVRIRRQLAGGGVQETRLQATPSEGSYRGAFPDPAASSNGLVMRVTVGDVSHEVPLAE
jgi:hypothetical protein